MRNLQRSLVLSGILFVHCFWAGGLEAQETPGSVADESDADVACEVVVWGNRPIQEDATQDSVEVQGEDLQDSARGSALEALASQSGGIYVTGHGALHGVANGASGSVHVRGLGGSPNCQVLVVEDGVPDYMGIFGHPIPDAYVPFLTDKALVIKGGDSVLYGSNAMGGVLVFRSRWRRDEGFELSNDVAYGSYATVRETVAGLAKWNNFELATAFHSMTTDGHRAGAGGNQMVGLTAARYRFRSDLRLTLREKFVHLVGADPGPVTHPYSNHWYDVWRSNTSARLEWAPRMLSLSVTPYFNFGEHRLYDGFLSRDTVTGAIVEGTVRLHKTTRLLLGLSGKVVAGDIDNRVSREETPMEDLTEISGYGQVTVRPWRWLTVVAGGRGLHSFTWGPRFLYKAGVKWTPFRWLALHSRISRNFRAPTLRELYLPFPKANPDLKPETSLNWDVGLGFETQHFEAAFTAYRTQADDLIRTFGVWPAAEVVNVDQVVIWGGEGRIAVKELGPLSLSLSGDWRDVGRYTRQNPEAKVNFIVDLGKPFGRHFLGASLTGEWVHGLYMANYSRNQLDDVYLMDLAVRYRYVFPERGVTLEPYVFLRNCLNQQTAYVEGYPMPGFNVLFGLKVGI